MGTKVDTEKMIALYQGLAGVKFFKYRKLKN
jgi:hypothetical protein